MANVRLIVYNASSLTTDETLLQSRLTSLGHTVSLQNTTTNPSPFPNAASWDLVVVARSSWYTEDLPASYLTVPQVNLQRFSWAAMGFDTEPGTAGATSTTLYQTNNSAHPVADGNTGQVTVATQGIGLRVFTSPPGSLQCVFRGDVSASTNSGGVHVVDSGAALNGGKTAGARMVIFGQANSDTVQHMTAAWWGIFDEAVVWALDAGGGGGSQLATPTNFTFAKAANLRKVDGAWTAVSQADHYEWEVERWTGSAWVAFDADVAAGTSFSLTDTDGVDWGTRYRGRVRAMPGV
jgi:hypothetical protein